MAPCAHELATSIVANLSKIQAFLESNKLPNLSIEEEVPQQFQADQTFAAPRDAALLACRELQAMLLGSFGCAGYQTVSRLDTHPPISPF